MILDATSLLHWGNDFSTCYEVFWVFFGDIIQINIPTAPHPTVELFFFFFFFSPVLRTTKDFRHLFPTHSENKAPFTKRERGGKIRQHLAPANRFPPEEEFVWKPKLFLKYNLNRDPGKDSAPTTFSSSMPWIVEKETLFSGFSWEQKEKVPCNSHTWGQLPLNTREGGCRHSQELQILAMIPKAARIWEP